MRLLKTHKTNGLNEAIDIAAIDEPGSGGANHHYRVFWNQVGDEFESLDVQFQNGPIAEAGVNGVSNEALLAIVEDRLVGFQSGPFACIENAAALDCVIEAMMILQDRTNRRIERGVEGTSQP